MKLRALRRWLAKATLDDECDIRVLKNEVQIQFPARKDERPKPRKPVCVTCKDTHKMVLHDSSGDERLVMCTRCPTPCDKCRQRSPGSGAGPYCETTPCGCDCHRPADRTPPAGAECPACHLVGGAHRWSCPRGDHKQQIVLPVRMEPHGAVPVETAGEEGEGDAS